MMRLATLGLALLTCSCNTQEREAHRALGAELDGAIRPACLVFDDKEGGGCYAECQTRQDARRGRATVALGTRLSKLPWVEGGHHATDRKTAELRERGAELAALLDKPCARRVASDGPPSPEAKQCAEAFRGASAKVRGLRQSIDQLAEDVREKLGAELRTVGEICAEGSR